MRSICNLVTSLLFVTLCYSVTEAAIPPAASADARYALGYLVCDHYGTNLSNGVNDATDEINTCVRDAYNNQLTAYLEVCNGVYLVSNNIKLYEWQRMDASGRLLAQQLANNVFRGAKCTPATRPTLKIKSGSTAFQDTAAPRPVVAYRMFKPLNQTGATLGCTTTVVSGCEPSHPLQNPPNFGDGAGNYFTEVFDNINIDTNGHAGAVGIAMIAGQGCLVANSKITLTNGTTHGMVGVYNPPGRNSPTVNIEVIGGQHCIYSGTDAAAGWPIVTGMGNEMVGIKCTNQTVSAFKLNESVPSLLIGFEITKSSNGPAIQNLGIGMVLKDGKITMSGAAANDVVIDNVSLGGRNLYVENVFVSGSTQLVQNGTYPTATGSGTWAHLMEYVFTDQYQKDTNTDAEEFPPYPVGTGREKVGVSSMACWVPRPCRSHRLCRMSLRHLRILSLGMCGAAYPVLRMGM